MTLHHHQGLPCRDRTCAAANVGAEQPSIKAQRARHAAEHLLAQIIAESMASYGEANWRQDLAPAIAARFGIYHDFRGRERRVMLAGPWEDDPYADGEPEPQGAQS